jgi:hypothetical protein
MPFGVVPLWLWGLVPCHHIRNSGEGLEAFAPSPCPPLWRLVRYFWVCTLSSLLTDAFLRWPCSEFRLGWVGLLLLVYWFVPLRGCLFTGITFTAVENGFPLQCASSLFSFFVGGFGGQAPEKYVEFGGPPKLIPRVKRYVR